MRFKIVTSVALVCCMVMFFGMLVFSVDNSASEEIYKEMISRAKTAKLEVNKHTEVNRLMNDYMKAKQTVNMQQLENCVNDISKYNANDLKQMRKRVQSVKNIKCYTIDGWEKDSYIVYLYYEYKVKNVRSNIPNLVRDIVCKDDNGKLCIFSGTMKSSTVRYIESTKSNPSVVNLINKVNKNVTSLKQKDSTVQTFFKAVEMQIKDNKKSYDKANDKNDDEKKQDKKGKDKKDNKKTKDKK